MIIRKNACFIIDRNISKFKIFKDLLKESYVEGTIDSLAVFSNVFKERTIFNSSVLLVLCIIEGFL